MKRKATLGKSILGSAVRVVAILALSVSVGAGYITTRFPNLRWLPDPDSIVDNPQGHAQAFISADETYALVQAGMDGSQNVALIDARPNDKFLEGHIAALTILNIHGDERYEYDLNNLDLIQGFKIVIYCTSTTCHLAGLVYDMLVNENGFEDVSIYHEGWEGWLETGYETEAGPEKYMGAPMPGAEAEFEGGMEYEPDP